MTYASSSLLSPELQLRIINSHGCGACNNLNTHNIVGKSRIQLVNIGLLSHGLRHDAWSRRILNSVRGPKRPAPSRYNVLVCQSALTPGGNEMTVAKSAAAVLSRTYDALRGSPVVIKLIPAVGVIAFAVWGIGPLMRLGRIVFLREPDNSWKKSGTHYVMTSYLQPLLLWTGATLVCRALDPVILPSQASQAVKQRIVTFVRSLSTVLAFSYCLSSLIQQARKFFAEANDYGDTRNMGFDFAGKAIYTAVWVAAVSLFMELLGFSTQKWLTAGGLGTVLLTLAGREIFTNFLSSIMIHATRPFVLNEWIQTKIEGYEVSGTVEHVGWWSPTIIRGDDREAVHIPNHKFTVSIVRNLSQKTHWRIKTHIAISHLDVHKINNIVADMRKVLAKNPQVEQQRLHRRVFLENINPENQALMILISCFVKTSHFEEYLCVKEAVILDLLRVVSHHRARLATPIRTVQKIYSEPDLEDLPFADTIFARSRAASDRPLLLIEPSYKINSDDKVKASNRSVRANEEKDAKVETSSTSESKANTEAKMTTNSNINSKISADSEPESRKLDTENGSTGDVEKGKGGSKSEGKLPGGVMQKTSAKQESGHKEGDSPANLQGMQDVDKTTAAPPVAKPPLEENIVLGVALEGSKRTLPIEEEEIAPSSSPADLKELTASRNGGSALSSVTDKKDGQMPTTSTLQSD